MKNRLNNKGFTLIETVITFAIVAVVGGMFILGFSNVVHIMTDAELIKNDTNNLYEYLLSENNTNTDYVLKSNDYKISIDLKDKNKTYNDETVTLTSMETKDGTSKIRLSKFQLKSSSSESGGNTGNSGNTGGSGNTGDTVQARFRFVKQIDGNFPMSLDEIKNKSWYITDDQYSYYSNSLSKNVSHSIYDINGAVNDYVGNQNQEDLSSVLQGLDNNYKTQLQQSGTNYKVFWFAIDMDTKMSTSNETIPTVYGIIYPSSYDKVIFNIRWNCNGVSMIPINSNSIDSIYHGIIWDNIKINGQAYSKNDIINCTFIEDGKDVYYAKE